MPTVLVHGLEFGIHDEGGVAAFDDVARVVANLIHAQDEVMIHSEHLRDGVVLARCYHHVLSSHVAMDVWLIEFHELGREEGVVPIGLTIGVRHVIRVNATREVAFGWGDFHVGVVDVLGADDLDVHQGSVADDGGNRNHREIRLPGGSDADGLGKRHDAGLTLRRGDLGSGESWQLQVNGDVALRRGDKRYLVLARGVAANGSPLLAEGDEAQHDEQDSKDMFFHSGIN